LTELYSALVQVIRQGESTKFEPSDIPHLDRLNKEFQRTLSKNPFDLNYQEGILTPKEALVGIVRIPSKTIVILPRFESFDFNVVMRLWFFTRSATLNLGKPFLPTFKLEPSRFILDITNAFVLAVRKILQRGLVCRYVLESGDLPFVKGKINFKETLRRNSLQFQQVFCDFEKISLDHELNQLVLFCINKLARLTQNPENRLQLAKLQYDFRSISLPTDFTSSKVDSIRLARNESYYQFVIELCNIIIKNLFYSYVGGAFTGGAFLCDFDQLFEDFITMLLTRYYYEPVFTTWEEPKKYGYYAYYLNSGQKEEKSKSFLPDLLYKYEPTSGTCKAVLDIKSKGGDPFINPDVFQMYFYCKTLRAKKGILIYPSDKNVEPIELSLTLPESEKVSMHAVYINLTGKETDFWQNIELFRKQIDQLVS